MFAIDVVKDFNGRKYFAIYEHGLFHVPRAVIAESNAKWMAHYILAGDSELPPVPDNRRIGYLLKQHRERLNHTQTKAAEIIEISRNYLAQVEGGEVTIGLEIYRKISAYTRDI
jgi:DNA-binding XRE family transcriptional regulator